MTMFNDKQVALMLKQQLIESLYKTQQDILRMERFGKNTVLNPALGNMVGAAFSLQELEAKHTELVIKIEALDQALGAANKLDIEAIVRTILERDRAKT